MLALDPQSVPLDAAEQFGLDLLLDLSRLLRFSGVGEVVQLRIVEGGGSVASLRSCIATRWHFEQSDGCITIPRGVLRLVTTIAGAEDEQRSTLRDRFGRVPPAANALVAEGLERSPVISLAASELRRAVVEVAGRRPVRLLSPWPEGKRWAVAFTHDVDVVALWPAFTALRLAELTRKAEFRRALAVIGAAARSLVGSPVWENVRDILETERHLGVRSTWFVLCGSPTLATARAGDLTYRLESAAARQIVSAVAADGHEIGLHGSFETYASADRMLAQRERMARVAGTPTGIRQHYLRMQPGETQRAMADAGFRYDSTFGFADRNGFRLGVADVLPAWHAARQSSLGIDELPFIWMDRALSKYRGVESPGAWVEDALALATACRNVEGLWTGVWHPNLAPALGFPEAPDAFRALVRGIAGESPWIATMATITAWRRARRSTRASGAADGPLTIETDHASPAPITVEDATGRALAERVRAAR